MPKRFNLEVTMSGRCIMMCAGNYHPMEIQRDPDDFVIAVDGGLSHLIRQGIRPDFLLGDFDSLGPENAEIAAGYRAMGESSFLQLPVLVPDDQVSFCLTDGTGRGDLFGADIEGIRTVQHIHLLKN